MFWTMIGNSLSSFDTFLDGQKFVHYLQIFRLLNLGGGIEKQLIHNKGVKVGFAQST